MNHSNRLLAASLAVCAGLFGQAPIQPAKTHLKVGDKAPDFSFTSSSQGKPIKLSDFLGKKTVVLAFFPAAFTGG